MHTERFLRLYFRFDDFTDFVSISDKEDIEIICQDGSNIKSYTF